MKLETAPAAERLIVSLEASAHKVANHRDVQSAWRHFVFPAIIGGLDCAQQIIMPIIDAWTNLQPVVIPNPKQAAGMVLHAAVVAGGSAALRYVHRWWIDLRQKIAPAEPMQ